MVMVIKVEAKFGGRFNSEQKSIRKTLMYPSTRLSCLGLHYLSEYVLFLRIFPLKMNKSLVSKYVTSDRFCSVCDLTIAGGTT